MFYVKLPTLEIHPELVNILYNATIDTYIISEKFGMDISTSNA